MAGWPTGIRPSGNGIRLRIWHKGHLVHSETLNGDPYNQADLSSAVKRREELVSRARLGLPLTQGAKGDRQVFADAAQEYLNTLDAKRNTKVTYTNILNRYWMPEFAKWPVDEVGSADIKRVLSSLSIAQKTKKNILIPLRGMLDYAEISPNPAAGIRLKKQQKEEIDRYTLAEREKLLRALEGQPKVYFSLLFGCGLRPGEALALKWADYNGQSLSISKQITRRRLENSTKTSESRAVYVPTWVRSALNSHTTRFQGDWIFLNTRGDHYRDTDIFNDAWRNAHQRARIAYRVPYACRHTRASELLSTGILPADAAQQMGHSVEMFLRTYARWIEEFAANQDMSRFEGASREAK